MFRDLRLQISHILQGESLLYIRYRDGKDLMLQLLGQVREGWGANQIDIYLYQVFRLQVLCSRTRRTVIVQALGWFVFLGSHGSRIYIRGRFIVQIVSLVIFYYKFQGFSILIRDNIVQPHPWETKDNWVVFQSYNV